MGRCDVLRGLSISVLMAAVRKRRPEVDTPAAPRVEAQAITVALALSLLNPQVSRDRTVGWRGRRRTPPADRLSFAIGVALVFTRMVLRSRSRWPITRLFAQPRALCAIDIGTSLVMLVLAAAIIINELGRP